MTAAKTASAKSAAKPAAKPAAAKLPTAKLAGPKSAAAKPNGPRVSVATRLRGEIEKAEAEGTGREAMTLHLTHSDVNALTRDPSLALDDLSFAGGTMRFLGVNVERGGVTESVLLHTDAA
jgi:hypothetical protein